MAQSVKQIEFTFIAFALFVWIILHLIFHLIPFFLFIRAIGLFTNLFVHSFSYNLQLYSVYRLKHLRLLFIRHRFTLTIYFVIQNEHSQCLFDVFVVQIFKLCVDAVWNVRSDLFQFSAHMQCIKNWMFRRYNCSFFFKFFFCCCQMHIEMRGGFFSLSQIKLCILGSCIAARMKRMLF